MTEPRLEARERAAEIISKFMGLTASTPPFARIQCGQKELFDALALALDGLMVERDVAEQALKKHEGCISEIQADQLAMVERENELYDAIQALALRLAEALGDLLRGRPVDSRPSGGPCSQCSSL